MTFTDLLFNYWQLNISALIIIVLLIVFNFITNGKRFTKKSIYFFIGIFLFILLTFSPINILGHQYLFSVHMIQHIVILLIIPPLLLIGTNKEFFDDLLKNPKINKAGKFLFNPMTTWMIGVGSMWVWHVPLLFKGMMDSELIHILEVISLLIAGFIFAWPVFNPTKFKKLEPLQTALYLFTACVGCTVLGIFITFAPAGFFSQYMMGNNPAILNYLQFDMGISPAIDQQAAGLIMWVPACLIYLSIILITLNKWYKMPEDEKDLKVIN
jgi:putative membrane protein